MISKQPVDTLVESLTAKPSHIHAISEVTPPTTNQPMFIGNNSFTMKDLACLEENLWLTDKVGKLNLMKIFVTQIFNSLKSIINYGHYYMCLVEVFREYRASFCHIKHC
jgi:hypothetical protein